MRNAWWRGIAGLGVFMLICGLPLITPPRQSLGQNVSRRQRIELEATNIPETTPMRSETVALASGASTTIMEQNFEGFGLASIGASSI